jgi:hypothetical protein
MNRKLAEELADQEEHNEQMKQLIDSGAVKR